MNFEIVFAFFILGLTGGFGHCTAMCNPVVILISSRFSKDMIGYKILVPHIFYNFGRVTTYMILGFIAGLLGSVIQYGGDTFMNIQRLSSIIGGSFMILYALSNLFNIHTKLFKKLNLSNMLHRFNPTKPFTFGLFFGLLPCGLSMGAIIGTLSISNGFYSALLMLCFGLGTSAAMMTMALFSSVAIKYVSILNKFAMIFLIIMGVYFLTIYYRY